MIAAERIAIAVTSIDSALGGERAVVRAAAVVVVLRTFGKACGELIHNFLAYASLLRAAAASEQRLLCRARHNFAERDLRPTVIARKVSFGSQSEAGAKTRAILMTVLVSLRKQHPDDYEQRFKSTLDEFVQNSTVEPYQLLFGA